MNIKPCQTVTVILSAVEPEFMISLCVQPARALAYTQRFACDTTIKMTRVRVISQKFQKPVVR